MFIAALFSRSKKTYLLKVPLKVKLINNLCPTHTLDYYIPVRMNDLYESLRYYFLNTILNVISQT